MLDITDHQGNANHSFQLTPARPKSFSKGEETASIAEVMEKREPLGGNVNWCSQCGKQEEIPQKLTLQPPYDPAIPHLGISLKEMKTLTQKIHAPPCSLQCYL